MEKAAKAGNNSVGSEGRLGAGAQCAEAEGGRRSGRPVAKTRRFAVGWGWIFIWEKNPEVSKQIKGGCEEIRNSLDDEVYDDVWSRQESHT